MRSARLRRLAGSARAAAARTRCFLGRHLALDPGHALDRGLCAQRRRQAIRVDPVRHAVRLGTIGLDAIGFFARLAGTAAAWLLLDGRGRRNGGLVTVEIVGGRDRRLLTWFITTVIATLARAIITATVVAGAILVLAVALALARPIIAGALVARTVLALAIVTVAVGAGLLVDADDLALVAEIVVHVELVEIVALATLLALLVGAAALIGEHAEVMVGELQIIFGVDAIARKLRIARHVAVLFQQLRRIAARPAVDTIAAVALALATLTLAITATAATATAAALTIVYQMTVPCVRTKTSSNHQRRANQAATKLWHVTATTL